MPASLRIVVKFGTSTLTDGTRKFSQPRIIDLVRQIAGLQAEGCKVVLVSSGAIAAGREVLGYPELPKFIPKKQMLAAVGQPRLMAMYQQFFDIFGERVAQVLLTRSDLTDRRRYLNARDTFEALLSQRVIPIVNENDTVATEEIRFGDNDSLSAQVASLIEADALVLLTDQEGVFTDDPRQNPKAKMIPLVEAIDFPETLWKAAGGSSNGLGTGGMVTKLHAADIARRAGVMVYIAKGSERDAILRIARKETVGTCFLPMLNKLESRKRYLLAGATAEGSISVDAGAARALARGGSLLPVGVTAVAGDFDRGDTVQILNPGGKMIALGLCNYAARDLAHFSGHQSQEIESLVGFTFGDEVVHRNNMILMRQDG